MSKKLIFAAPLCALILIFASCSLFSDDNEGTSVSFTIDSKTAQKLMRSSGAGGSENSRAGLQDLNGLYINMCLRGSYEDSQFAQITSAGLTLSFDGIPVGENIYAYAEIYSTPQSIQYKGRSQTIEIERGDNELQLKLLDIQTFASRYPNEPANTNNPDPTAVAQGNGGGSGSNGGSSNSQGMTYGEFVQMPFSIAADKQVYFSPGNLWYQASTSTFKFSEHQYDIVGKNANEAAFTAFISNDPTSYTGWTDLFEWGSSGAGRSGIDYPPYTRKFPDGLQNALHVASMTGENAQLDWGVHNAISNGGNQAGLWRTLTWDEWNYLFHSRSGAPLKRAPARINGIAGMILFPDTWNPASMPGGLSLNYTNSSNSSDYYGTNTYTALEWSQLEALGAVFLPATGTCYSGVSLSATSPNWDGYDGSDTSTSNTKYVSYWTATAYSAGSDTKYKFYTSNGGYNKGDIGTKNDSANTPAAVRLIQDRPDYYVVPSVNPSQLYVSPTGTETGDGSESSPFATIAQAVAKIKSFGEAQDYTIFIDGTLTTEQEIKNISKAYAKSITVKGKNGLDESTHEPNDALAGNYSYGSNAKMLLIETAVPVIVEDLKISGGYAQGGGVYIGSRTVAGDVTLSSGVLITGNKSSGNGAGVYVDENSKLTIDGAVIKENMADPSSSTSAAQGIGVYSIGKELVIKGSSKITGNSSRYTGGNYSAVYCEKKNTGDKVTIEGNAEISNNEVRGLYITGVPLTLKGNCKITGNHNNSTGSNGGGGIFATAGDAYEITISENAEISGNSAKNAGGLYIASYNVTVNFSGGSISGNTLTDATGKGKGVYLWMSTVTEDRFIMSGTAVIASNNDIYLAGDSAKITAGSLTPPAGVTTVATITPYNNTYSDTKQVLNGSLAGAYQLFAVTPDSSSSPSTPWYVGSNGYLTQTQP